MTINTIKKTYPNGTFGAMSWLLQSLVIIVVGYYSLVIIVCVQDVDYFSLGDNNMHLSKLSQFEKKIVNTITKNKKMTNVKHKILQQIIKTIANRGFGVVLIVINWRLQDSVYCSKEVVIIILDSSSSKQLQRGCPLFQLSN